jgi:hypothetical protein
MRIAASVAIAVLLSLQPSANLHAQLFGDAPAPGQDFGSARLNLGLLSPLSTFTDPSFGESSFASAPTIGASVLVWPWQGNLGIGAQLFRSKTDGENETSEFAPIAVNDPVQWFLSAELAYRFLSVVDSGFPYLSAGVGLKQYNWATYGPHRETRNVTWGFGGGFEVRPAAIGPLGLTVDVRSIHSSFIAFGIDGGNWEKGDWEPNAPGLGKYGGIVDGQANHDLFITAGLTFPF